MECAVGAAAADRFRLFRYEVPRWRDGVVPDVAEAVASPRRLTGEAGRPGGTRGFAARRALDPGR